MAGDAVSVAPDHYKVLEENDRVRILEFRGGPGAKTAMHSHPAMVAVPVSRREGALYNPRGTEHGIGADRRHGNVSRRR